MKTLRPSFIPVLLLLASCGGTQEPITYRFHGLIAGSNCFEGFPSTEQVNYQLSVPALAKGAAVTLTDQNGTIWSGEMTSETMFTVKNAQPNADPRLSIAGSGLSNAGLHVDSTTQCVSFRCCTTLRGDLTA
ncbi:hypothetical protein E4K72_23290 [Oxalobacteraceae bacterium OM1]|nr:hypothetical protein E4K72_23290 [Oxalobacteraceae bacterium OM1]